MNAHVESKEEEAKIMLQVKKRNELGWGVINDLIKWLNPGGQRTSLYNLRYVF